MPSESEHRPHDRNPPAAADAAAGRGFARLRRLFGLALLATILALPVSPAAGLLGLGAAQAAPFEAEAPPPSLARLYFYRQPTPLMIALTPEVIVNGQSVGALSMGEVFFRDAKPGRYRIFLSGDPAHVLEMTLAAGEVVFVRATLRIGLGSTRISAERIGAATAAAEIDELDDPANGPEPQTTQR